MDISEMCPKTAIVTWNEDLALCQAFRERRPRFARLSAEEREEEWRKIDSDTAKLLSRRVAWLLDRPGPARKRKNGKPIELKPTSYAPPKLRLRFTKRLQDHGLHYDEKSAEGTIPDISVFCDLLTSCSDFFLSPLFRYRSGRPFRQECKVAKNAPVPYTVPDIQKYPYEYQIFAHSQQGTCVCKCDDCTTDPTCSCSRLAKFLNGGNVVVKNGLLHVYNEVDLNHEELNALVIGCGVACPCYEHKKCNRNLDTLLLQAPTLEIFRKNTAINFGVRTLSSLKPGDFVTEFTGQIETDNEVADDHPKAIHYAFKYVFDNMTDFLIAQVLAGLEKYPEYTEFKNLYNDLAHFKKVHNKLPELYINPFDSGNVAQFINHGCLPNCHVVRVVANHLFPQFHRLFIFAAFDVQAGSELSINYGEDYARSFGKQCQCNTEFCLSGPNSKFISTLTRASELESYLRDQILPLKRKFSEDYDLLIKDHIENNPDFRKNASLPFLSKNIKIIKESPEIIEENREVYDMVYNRFKAQVQEFDKLSAAATERKQMHQHRRIPDEFSKLPIKLERPEILVVHCTSVVDLETPLSCVSSEAKPQIRDLFIPSSSNSPGQLHHSQMSDAAPSSQYDTSITEHLIDESYSISSLEELSEIEHVSRNEAENSSNDDGSVTTTDILSKKLRKRKKLKTVPIDSKNIKRKTKKLKTVAKRVDDRPWTELINEQRKVLESVLGSASTSVMSFKIPKKTTIVEEGIQIVPRPTFPPERNGRTKISTKRLTSSRRPREWNKQPLQLRRNFQKRTPSYVFDYSKQCYTHFPSPKDSPWFDIEELSNGSPSYDKDVDIDLQQNIPLPQYPVQSNWIRYEDDVDIDVPDFEGYAFSKKSSEMMKSSEEVPATVVVDCDDDEEDDIIPLPNSPQELEEARKKALKQKQDFERNFQESYRLQKLTNELRMRKEEEKKRKAKERKLRKKKGKEQQIIKLEERNHTSCSSSASSSGLYN